MAKALYLDSSALGMLLLLRDHAGGDSANVQITKCNQDVKKILTISNFEQLFKID
jgi:anti-anti-sigma regulatory factor